MPVHNREIAQRLEQLADLLEIEGADRFRVIAYRNAARTVERHPHELADMVAQGEDLTRLSGVGEAIAKKIETLVQTGSLPQLQAAGERVPPHLRDLLHLPGLGPKRVRALHDALGIEDLDDLRRALDEGKVQRIEGFGEKTAQRLREAVAHREPGERRMLLADVEPIAASLLDYLRRGKGVKQAIVAGSYRRRRDTVGDLDVLVTARRGTKVSEHFVAYDEVAEVVSQGSTRSTVRLRSGLQVDLRVVPEVSYGAALHYFTGSKAHNIAVRRRAQAQGLKANEYGVFRGKRRLAGRTEEEVYARVGLPYIEPELRENRGELEAAEQGRLPRLIALEHLRGDLHAHTTATDGSATLEEMAEAAKALGYEYLAITDHTQRVTIAHGQDERRLAKQLREIDRLNSKLGGLTLLKGAEVDILADGRLDLDDGILRELDLAVCAVHFDLGLTRDKQTSRILKAMDHPDFSVLAHPTGRLLGERDPIDVDLERVMHAARERGVFLELDSQPQRLDLTDEGCRLAREIGVKVSLVSDAHTAAQLGLVRYGIGQARRGWLEPDDVINTRSLDDLRELLRR